MDDPALPAGEHRLALRHLARLNRISRTARVLWPFVRASRSLDGPTSILDVAAGSGDVPLALARLAQRAGVELELHALDISPVAVQSASERVRAAGFRAQVEVRDVVREGLGRADASIDVVTCSLFLHHLTEQEVVVVLGEMARVARRCLLVSDLRRCRTGLVAAFLATRVLPASRIVRVDAVRSVRAAFSEAEMKALAQRAGLKKSMILHRWPYRMLLIWNRA
ncbi:class I SAM-dependent methyltransferase [soil metagenome]